MANTEISEDKRIVEEFSRIMDLEKKLITHHPFSRLSTIDLRFFKGIGLNEEEIDMFFKKDYGLFRDHISRVVGDRLRKFYSQNEETLKGTHEGRLTEDLIKNVGGRFVHGEDAYDFKIEVLPPITPEIKCDLNEMGVYYIGQLVQKTASEISRTRHLSSDSFNKLIAVLTSYGLEFGMNINYKPKKKESHSDDSSS